MPVAYNIRLYIVIYSVQNKKLVVIKGGLSGYSLTGITVYQWWVMLLSCSTWSLSVKSACILTWSFRLASEPVTPGKEAELTPLMLASSEVASVVSQLQTEALVFSDPEEKLPSSLGLGILLPFVRLSKVDEKMWTWRINKYRSLDTSLSLFKNYLLLCYYYHLLLVF